MVEKWVMSPNFSARTKGLDSIWGVIVHYTVSGGDTGQAIADFFSRESSQVSAHVVIDEHGAVWHCVPIEKRAWHAGYCKRYDWDRDGVLEDWESYVNDHTIGIEFCNTGSKSDNYPDAQIKSAAQLIRRWDKKCPNLKLRNITDHQTVNLNGKTDVKENFPAAKLFWYIIHPYTEPPNDVYSKLPKWAKRQVDEIKG